MAALVVSVALGSSNIPVVNIPIGRTLRWAVLAELAVVALLYALVGRRRVRLDATALLAVALLGLALLSAAWSIDDALTLGRGATLVVLFVIAFAVAHGSGGRERQVGQVLLAILVAVSLVAIAGAIELFVRPDLARVPATTGTPLRFNGLGGNPNTMAMLVALGLPLSVWVAVEAPRRALRIPAVAIVVLLYVSIVASGSRGALVAGMLGALVAALAALPAPTRRSVALSAGGAVALLVAGLGLMQVPPPAVTNPVISNRIAPPAPKPFSSLDAQLELPLENEISFPERGRRPRERGLLDSSGRVDAARGAIRQAAERPLLGYGFGTEERTFVDRYYLHFSDRVENAYLGTLLQLGIVGFAALLALLGSALVGAYAAVRDTVGSQRRVAGATGGVVAAGVVLAFGQSYLTSVGSPATAPFWLCGFLAVAIAQRAKRVQRGEGGEGEEEPAKRQAEASLDVVRAEHEGVGSEEHGGAGARPATTQRER